jgi:hypothetical protein
VREWEYEHQINIGVVGRQLEAQTNFIKKNLFSLKKFNNYYFFKIAFVKENSLFIFNASKLTQVYVILIGQLCKVVEEVAKAVFTLMVLKGPWRKMTSKWSMIYGFSSINGQVDCQPICEVLSSDPTALYFGSPLSRPWWMRAPTLRPLCGHSQPQKC